MAKAAKQPSDRIKISKTELAVAREKVIRAGKHLEVAARMIRRFIRNDCGLRTKFNPKTQEFDVTAVVPPPPTIIGLLIGDCVHNLRSAIDHVVFALVTSNPNRPPGVPNRQTMFPIRDTSDGYRHQVDKLNRIKGVTEPVAALIEKLQPYHTRDKGLDPTMHPLWVLDTLENIDKHRRLTLTSGIGRHSHVSVRYKDGGETDVIIAQDRIHDRAILWSYPPARDGSEVQMNGYLMVYVALSEVEELPSLADEDIVRVLSQLIDYVGMVLLPRFVRLAPGNPAPKKRRRRQDFRGVPPPKRRS